MNIVFSANALKVVGIDASKDFAISTQELPGYIGGALSANVNVGDAVVDKYSGSSLVNNFKIGVRESTWAPGYSFVNNTPSVVSVDASGYVSYLSSGLAQVGVATPVGTRWVVRNMISDLAAPSGNFWKDYRAGSLGKDILTNMLALVNGKTPGGTTKNAFTSNNYSTVAPAATRNPNLFCGSLDLTGVTVVNDPQCINSSEQVYGDVGSVAGYGHPGMLISPRHIIGANHWHGKGPWVWKGADNNYYSASLVHGQAVAGTDIWVGYLDAAINAAVSPLRVLPSTYKTYLKNADNSVLGNIWHNLPALTKIVHDGTPYSATSLSDTWQCVALNALSSLSYVASSFSYIPWTNTGFDARVGVNGLEPWILPITGGDSGGPVIVPVTQPGGIKPVLISAWYTPIGGPSYAEYITQIESAMNTLANAAGDFTAYSLLKADLSGFTVY